MTWTVLGIECVDGKTQIQEGEIVIRNPEGKAIPLNKCPPWGWVALIDQGIVTPEHPYLQTMRQACKDQYELVLQNHVWRQRDCTRRMFQSHDWIYLSTEAFEKRLENEGLPADMIMLVMRARLAPESPMLSKLDACVNGLNDILDYCLTYKLSHLSIDNESDEGFNCDEIEVELYFEPEQNITYTMRLEVRDGKVIFEMSEDGWSNLDDHNDVWVYLFVSAHHSQACALAEIEYLVDQKQDLDNSRKSQLKALNEALDKASKMLEYEADWDDEGARPILPATFEKAKTFLVRTFNEHGTKDLPVPCISACADGTIDIFWKSPDYSLLINVKSEPGLDMEYCGKAKDESVVKGAFSSTVKFNLLYGILNEL